MIFGFMQRIVDFASDEKFKEILSGSIWTFVASVIATILGLLSSIVIAKIYGAEAVGVVAVTNSVLMFAALFAVLGSKTSILRFLPEHLTKFSPTSAFKIYHKIQYLVILCSAIIGIILFLSAGMIADKIFHKIYLTKYFSLAAAFVVFKSLTELNTQAVRGLRLIHAFVVMKILPHGLNLGLLVGLGWIFSSGKSVPVFALLGSFALTGLVGLSIMEYAFRKRIRPEDKVQHTGIGEILSISIPMFLTASMTFVIGQTGVLMLGAFRSEAEVGYYAIAVNLATLTTFILSSVNSMSAPKFSELFHLGKIDELFYVAKKSAKMIFWVTTPVLLIFVAFGRPVLNLFYGQEFTAAYPALLLLVLGQFVHSISGSTGVFMNMTGRQIVFRNIMLIVAILNIALNWLLIPSFGINGSAFAATISLSLWNIVIIVYMKIKFGKTTGYFPKLF